MDSHVNVGMVGGVENTALAYRLPLGSVLRMTLVGKDYRMPAKRAYDLGLVDELIERDQLMESAREMASLIAANSPAAVQRSKQAVWQSREVGYAHAAEYGWALVRMQWGHPDFREGPRAFRGEATTSDGRTREHAGPRGVRSFVYGKKGEELWRSCKSR